MTSSGFLAADAAAAVRDLRAAVRGEVPADSDPAHDGARRIWNGAADPRPAAIVRCADADNVAVVRVARGHDLPLSVLGGGHAHSHFPFNIQLDGVRPRAARHLV